MLNLTHINRQSLRVNWDTNPDWRHKLTFPRKWQPIDSTVRGEAPEAPKRPVELVDDKEKGC